jgi:eukaryotic-like serine/threonine-protein kinase
MHLSQGQVLGRYELLLPVARGGMAEVWAARLHGSRGFRKLVAVKTILPSAIDSARMEQMFLAEAELASSIDHPNVVQTLELGEHEGTLYLVLEWVDGEPLSALLAQSKNAGGIPLRIAVNLIGQACKGLHAAHELKDESGQSLGVVHRDISPQNILVGFSGTAKVVDFGIAKATQVASTLTEAGEVKGKLAYMAPEQIRGADLVDRRADVFSMGTLLYLMSTGRHPFRGDHAGATLKNITDKGSVTPPSVHVEDYPAELEQVVLKALQKDPDDRFATALDMLRALEQAMPEALEGTFYVQVAEFVTGIAGTSAHRRQQLIRQAGEALDKARAASGSSLEPTGPSSLSALSIDGAQYKPGAASSASHAAEANQVAAFRPRAVRTKLLIGLGAIALGAGLGVTLAGGERAAVQPVPAGQPALSTLPPGLDAANGEGSATAQRPAPPSEAPTPAASAHDEVEAPAPPKAQAKSAKVAPRQLWRPPVASAAPPVKAPPVASSTEPAADSAPPAGAPSALQRLETNGKPKNESGAADKAWNPDAFGARH